MKRDIKFRVWDGEKMLNNDKFTILNYLEVDGGTVHAATVYDKDCILMQFIGLTDKNGKEIYEGDIVEYENSNAGYGRPREQEITKDEVCWATLELLYKLKWTEMELGCLASEQIEIIGNIYENPELLKQ